MMTAAATAAEGGGTHGSDCRTAPVLLRVGSANGYTLGMGLLQRLLNLPESTPVQDGTDLTDRGDQTTDAAIRHEPQQPETTDEAEDRMDHPIAEPPLRVRRLRPGATLPVRGPSGSVGYVLHADLSEVPMPSFIPNVNRHYVDLGQNMRATIPTGIDLALPPSTYGRILPRFDLGPDSGVAVVNPVLDAMHRGELVVTLENIGTNRALFRQGDAIAALVLERVALPNVVEVDASEVERVDEEVARVAAPA